MRIGDFQPIRHVQLLDEKLRELVQVIAVRRDSIGREALLCLQSDKKALNAVFHRPSLPVRARGAYARLTPSAGQPAPQSTAVSRATCTPAKMLRRLPHT